MNPTVSIITPSFNQGQFIERTIRSVANQTGAAIEHVIFDGGSTDNTIEILKRFSSQVRWVSEKDNGQADAVNKGLLKTNGDIIGWLNSDDIYYEGTIACIADYLRKNPEIDAVYGMADYIDLEDRVIGAYPTEPWNFERLTENCFICQPALFLRRHVVEQHGLLDPSLYYCMDYEYWLRLGKEGVRFTYFPQKLAGSRLYAGNKTMLDRVKVHLEIHDMLKKKLGRVPDSWLFGYANAGLERRVGGQRSIWTALEIRVRFLLASLQWNHGISLNKMKDIKKRGEHRRWPILYK